jgi:hypothetical protein
MIKQELVSDTTGGESARFADPERWLGADASVRWQPGLSRWGHRSGSRRPGFSRLTLAGAFLSGFAIGMAVISIACPSRSWRFGRRLP